MLRACCVLLAAALARAESGSGDFPHPPASPSPSAPACEKPDFLQCVAEIHAGKQEGGDDLGADGDESTPGEDRQLIEMLLAQQPGITDSNPKAMEIAETLMYVNVFPMCKCMHRWLKVENDDDICDANLKHALMVWRPWCRLLAQCQTVGEALLRAAYVCKAEGMHEYSASAPAYNPESVICKDSGQNNCALAMEELFVTTHANFTQILNRGDEISDALGEDMKDSLFETISDVDDDINVPGAKASPPPPPLSPGTVNPEDFARLSVCMHRASVNHESLDLPMGLRQISGNGTYTSYADLFYDKCGVEYQWAWVWDDLYYYSGLNYAAQKYDEGTTVGKAIAIAILVIDVLVMLCLIFCLVRCIRKGYCFWLCLKISSQEKASLTSEGASRAEGALDESTEMGVLGKTEEPALTRLDDDLELVDASNLSTLPAGSKAV